jgi:hypothetical protein
MASKVENTGPKATENDYRITYSTGSQKWTNDRPGDGIGDLEHMLDDIAVQRGLDTIAKSIDNDGKGLKSAVDAMVRDTGTDRGQTVLNAVYKGMKESNASEKQIHGWGEARGMVAGVKDVVEKIFDTFPINKATEMAERLVKYYKTKDGQFDLTPREQSQIYNRVDYGDTLPLTKKRKLDVEWTNHGEYRSDLRDIDPDAVNHAVQQRLREKLNPPQRKTLKFKEPGVGHMVVDFDTKKKPADAKVVTVYGSEDLAEEVLKIARELVADEYKEKRDKNIETLKKKDDAKKKEKQEKVLKKIDEGLKKRKEKENWTDAEYEKHRERKHKKYLQDGDASPDVVEDLAKPAIKKVKKVIDKFRGKGKSKGDKGKGKNEFTKKEWADYKKKHPNTKIKPNIVSSQSFTDLELRVAARFASADNDLVTSRQMKAYCEDCAEKIATGEMEVTWGELRELLADNGERVAAKGVFDAMTDRQIKKFIEGYAEMAPENFWMDGEFDGTYDERVKDLMRWWRSMNPKFQQQIYDDYSRYINQRYLPF